MSAARQVRISYELRATDAAQDDARTARDAPTVWWEESTRGLRQSLAALGPGARPATDGLRIDRSSARFMAEVAAGVVSEAVRLTMTWIGRSPQREATLTGPHGHVLLLTGAPRTDDLDVIARWLAAATGPGGEGVAGSRGGAGGRAGSGGGVGAGR